MELTTKNKEIDALKAENKELNEQLRLHSVSNSSEKLHNKLDGKNLKLNQKR